MTRLELPERARDLPQSGRDTDILVQHTGGPPGAPPSSARPRDSQAHVARAPVQAVPEGAGRTRGVAGKVDQDPRGADGSLPVAPSADSAIPRLQAREPAEDPGEDLLQ